MRVTPADAAGCKSSSLTVVLPWTHLDLTYPDRELIAGVPIDNNDW